MDPAVRADLEVAGVRVEERFDGARFDLPPRAPLRAPGIAMTVFGLAVTVFMVFWMKGPIGSAIRGAGGLRIFLLVFGLLGLPGLAVGLAMLTGGAALWRGRSRAVVEVAGGRLRVTEYFPPFRWTWRRKVADVRRFTLGLPPSEDRAAPRPEAMAAVASRFLRAEGAFPNPLWIATFYPETVLRPLAAALADATSRARPDAAAPPVAVVHERDAGGGDAVPEPAIPRPPKTKVAILELPEGFAIDVPPVGLWRGSKGLLFFSLLWLGMCTLIFGIMFKVGGPAQGRAIAGLFALLFFGIGFAMLGAAIHMGRRSAMLAANARTLGLRRRGLFGTKEERIPRAEIAAIRCGPSGMEVNDRPVPELQLRLRGGRKVGVLSQLSEDELEWIAYELRRRLGVPREPPPA